MSGWDSDPFDLDKIEKPRVKAKPSESIPYYPKQESEVNNFEVDKDPFSTVFPRVDDYFNMETVLATFPHFEKINDFGFDLSKVSEHAQFYVLRCSNDDNIHKSIKYQVWSTTAIGKSILSNAWKSFEERNLVPEIYLIFSVVNSSHFLGVAKMTSDIKHDESFMFWWEPTKWFGTFNLEWIFVKDIHHSRLDHIKETKPGFTSFISLKDTTELSHSTGKEILQIFKEYIAVSSVFSYFVYMDYREDYIRCQRLNDKSFQNYFRKCCTIYLRDPNGFTTSKKNHQTAKVKKISENGPKNKAERIYKDSQNAIPSTLNKVKQNGIMQNKYNKKKKVVLNISDQFIIKTVNKKNK